MLSLKSLSPAIIYPASVVIGFGAAILWVAQVRTPPLPPPTP
jgi:hypothetical protein